MNYTLKIAEYKENCRPFMAECGIPFYGDIITDGKIHRYSADENKNKKDEWYVGYEGVSSRGNDYLTIIFGSWSTGTKYEYRSFDKNTSINQGEIEELKEIARINRLRAEQDIKENYNKAAAFAQQFWNQCSIKPTDEEHTQYVRNKGINPTANVRFGRNQQGCPVLIIPIVNIHGELRSFQGITPNGDKRFSPGGEKKGNFHIIGSVVDQEPLYITEGYATGVSVHTATGAATVVAFGAGNIESVTENIKNKYPNSMIIIAGDNGDTGIEKATEAAKKFGCRVIFPQFPEDKKLDKDGEPYMDFNDLHQIAGVSEVTLQLQKAISVKTNEEELKELAQSLSCEEDPCEDFDAARLPEPLRDYISSLCETTDAHPIMITTSVLATASAFFGTKVFISKDDYYQDLYPNMWFLCVAKSGQFKTTALNAGAEIALEQQARIFKKMKQLQHEIEVTPDGTHKLSLIEDRLHESRNNVVLPTKLTGEALIRHMSRGHHGVIYASEFGAWLQNLAKTHNNDLKGILTDLFDVPTSWRNLTKTQGDDILEKPFISLCGCCTVEWLQKTLEDDDVAIGFFARFLIFTPPHTNGITEGLPSPDKGARLLAKAKFEAILRNILADIGETRQFRLSQEAQRLFNNKDGNKGLHQKIQLSIQSYDDKSQEILAPYGKRWSPYLLKLSMIMQLFYDPKSTEISPQALAAASAILFPAIKSTAYLFKGTLGESDFQRKCRTLLEFICKKTKETGKPVERKMISASRKLKGGVKEYDSVLNTLIDEGKVIYEEKKPKNQSLYRIAPTVENG